MKWPLPNHPDDFVQCTEETVGLLDTWLSRLTRKYGDEGIAEMRGAITELIQRDGVARAKPIDALLSGRFSGLVPPEIEPGLVSVLDMIKEAHDEMDDFDLELDRKRREWECAEESMLSLRQRLENERNERQQLAMLDEERLSRWVYSAVG